MPWILIGSVGAGALNYGFGLAMTALLRPTQYSVFASANAVVIVVGTIANAAVPWMLAREIAKRPAGESDGGAVWAALLLNLGAGSLAGLAALLFVLTFADFGVAVWVGTATLAFFVASTGMGWAQGHQRFRLLGCLIVSEVVVRVVCGVALIALGYGPAGAYVGAVLGAVVIFLGMAPRMWPELRPRRGALDRRRARSALGSASVQALVTALSVADVVFVSLRFGPGSTTASYQVAAALGRTPVFIALAFATESFPSLARHPGDTRLLTGGIARLLAVIAPLTVIVMTLPGLVIRFLPDGYQQIDKFLPAVALIGAGYSLVLVQSTALRAAGRIRPCLYSLVGGLVISVVCMTLGSSYGTIGMAVGAAFGSWLSVVALALVTEREWPGATRPQVRALAVWVVVGILLFMIRTAAPSLWIGVAAVAALASVRAAVRVPTLA